ncbi:MAG: hypothetical protein WCI77_00580 [Candidatus Omnitrophota bacterium]
MRKEDTVRKSLCNGLFAAVCAFLFFFQSVVAQEAYQRAGSAKENAQGGYDFYSSVGGQKTGYSKKNRFDGYDYYDGRGNRIGVLKKDKKTRNTYSFYNNEGLKAGIVVKQVTGVYYYKDARSGGVTSIVPLVRNDPGSLPPEIFQSYRGQ